MLLTLVFSPLAYQRAGMRHNASGATGPQEWREHPLWGVDGRMTSVITADIVRFLTEPAVENGRLLERLG